MKALFIGLMLGIATFVSGQTILNVGELCAAGKNQLLCGPVALNDTRSDSLDILHTYVYLNVTNFAQKQISGNAELQITRKSPAAQQISLDLLDLAVDSVHWNGISSAFNLQDDRLTLWLPAGFDSGDTALVRVWYKGQPAQDASGWGGFYWQTPYAYNLGVGFAADPHNYGRVWFPCFDNFEERCGFTFDIETTADKRAFCNGQRQSETILPNANKLTRWHLNEAIPSYLACVAVGPYADFVRQYPGENGLIPVQIAVAPADSNALRNSFVHLPDALAAYEHWYGPYRWNKIGYSVVPFTSGAMEHATNIAYMKASVNGTTGSETLMAHEFSHHWWGDLVTCSTAEDMWLNEGWASYSEHLFLEWVYGKTRYNQTVEDNYLNVLQRTHIEEGGYRAVSGVPHDLTYGQHVYNKGAAVAHNLRGYLGDSLFRIGLRSVMAQRAFNDWSSQDMQTLMSAATGTDLSHFFEDWVFQPGFIDFFIDSTWVTNAGQPTLHARVRQSLRGATHFCTNVPLEYSIVRANHLETVQSLLLAGTTGVIDVPLSAGEAQPHIYVNNRLRLLQARAVQEKAITATGSQSFSKAKMDLKINAVSDTAFVRIEHHFSQPTVLPWYNPNQYVISNRFWEIDGFWPTDFNADANIIYDGRGGLDQLDNELFELTGNNEDNVIIVYRPAQDMPWQPWQEVTGITKNILSNANDSWGKITIPNVQRGQYAVAKKTGSVGVETPETMSPACVISPNPAGDKINVQSGFPIQKIRILDSRGVPFHQFEAGQVNEFEISVAHLLPGLYLVEIAGEGRVEVLKMIRQ